MAPNLTSGQSIRVVEYVERLPGTFQWVKEGSGEKTGKRYALFAISFIIAGFLLLAARNSCLLFVACCPLFGGGE